MSDALANGIDQTGAEIETDGWTAEVSRGATVSFRDLCGFDAGAYRVEHVAVSGLGRLRLSLDRPVSCVLPDNVSIYLERPA